MRLTLTDNQGTVVDIWEDVEANYFEQIVEESAPNCPNCNSVMQLGYENDDDTNPQIWVCDNDKFQIIPNFVLGKRYRNGGLDEDIGDQIKRADSQGWK